MQLPNQNGNGLKGLKEKLRAVIYTKNINIQYIHADKQSFLG